MQRLVRPSDIKGTIKAPTSKSMMQRSVAAALLSDGYTVLRNPSFCDDSMAALDIARRLGAVIEINKDEVLIKGGFAPKEHHVNCHESGLCMRMFTPIASLHNSLITINGSGSLLKRPVGMIEDGLTPLGVECKTNNGLMPVTVKGPLHGGTAMIGGSITSQLLTGLLMALPLVKSKSHLVVHDLKSKPYVDMTLQVLSDFGIEVENMDYEAFNIAGNQKYRPGDHGVEGDWSGASFLLVAAALSGEVTVTMLQKKSVQSDKAIVEVLRKTGAVVVVKEDCIEVKKNMLKAFEFDATECPDLFPPLVALAAHCIGITTIKGVERLKHKESDRAVALREEFGKLGVDIRLDGDEMIIRGGQVKGGKVHSHNDHRVAMAAAVTAVAAQSEVIIDGAQCVAKSYAEFFDDMDKIMVPSL
jgi:3-phosphoshikimate 1-carboxyvinyltransferase